MPAKNAPKLVPELACMDVETSRSFYVDVLGFNVLYQRQNQGFFYLERQGVEIMIEQLSGNTWKSGELERPLGRGLHFQIMTENVQALYDRCVQEKATIFNELEDAWYRSNEHYVGQRQFVVLDPDGYMLRFAEDLGKQAEPPSSGRQVS